jgi:hypothetical protein
MRVRLWIALGVVLLLPLAQAGAQVTQNFFNYCTTGSIRSCVSVQVQTTAILGGGTAVVMRVRNLQGQDPNDNTGGTRVTNVGLWAPDNIGTASGLAVSSAGGATSFGDPGSKWSFDPAGSANLGGTLSSVGITAIAGGILGCDNSGAMGGPNASWFRTCGDGQWVVFSFNTTGDWSATDAQIAWGVRGDSGSFQCQAGDDCSPPTIPEPAALALLMVGLTGMAGVRALRRRTPNVDA